MQTWVFVFRLQGTGRNEGEALDNALDAFEEDAGYPDTSELIADDKHIVQQILDYYTNFNGERLHCFSYSGRGMGGRRCLAVEARSFGHLAGILARQINEHNCQEISEALENLHSDQLGQRMVFYFPHISYVEDTETSVEPDDPDES